MSASTSPAEANVAKTRRFVNEVQQGKRLDLFDEFFSPNFIDHAVDGTSHDASYVRAMFGGFAAVVWDLKVHIITSIGQDDFVATNKVFTGTFGADLPGMGKKGEKLDMRVMDFVRWEGGRMVEHWATMQSQTGAS